MAILCWAAKNSLRGTRGLCCTLMVLLHRETTEAWAAPGLSGQQDPLLLMDVFTLQGPELHLDVSTLQGSEQHLGLSGQHEPVLPLQGPELHLDVFVYTTDAFFITGHVYILGPSLYLDPRLHISGPRVKIGFINFTFLKSWITKYLRM